MKRMSLNMQITRKCNNMCVFCSNPQFDKELTAEEAKKMVKDFKDDGINEIFLTGGEPTLVNFLPELIKYATEIGLKIRMISNGVNLYDPAFTDLLYQNGLRDINISVHSHIESDADFLSNMSGHFKKTLQGIGNCLNSGIRVMINTTINTKNSFYLSEMILYFIVNFPKIKHFVFNNLDSGKSDGYILNRAGENPWIIANFIDFELELSRTAKILRSNNKTFRIERVPLCYMNEFEEFSTETRKIVKDEKFRVSFIEKDRENEFRIVSYSKPENFLTPCKFCQLNGICNGVDPGYTAIKGKAEVEKEIYPVFKSPMQIINKILSD